LNVVFEVLHHLDPQIEIVLCVTEDELAHVLSLVRALLDDEAVVLEEVVYEEFVELGVRAVRVLVDLAGEGLAEDQGVHEAARDWLKLPQQHQQVGVENCQFVGTLVEGLDDQIDL
jgi:hypothetical protein